jgi:hypothetical protein
MVKSSLRADATSVDCSLYRGEVATIVGKSYRV